jgi:hypothetical protein
VIRSTKIGGGNAWHRVLNAWIARPTARNAIPGAGIAFPIEGNECGDAGIALPRCGVCNSFYLKWICVVGDRPPRRMERDPRLGEREPRRME